MRNHLCAEICHNFAGQTYCSKSKTADKMRGNEGQMPESMFARIRGFKYCQNVQNYVHSSQTWKAWHIDIVEPNPGFYWCLTEPTICR